jgi:hypothetical protein
MLTLSALETDSSLSVFDSSPWQLLPYLTAFVRKISVASASLDRNTLDLTARQQPNHSFGAAPYRPSSGTGPAAAQALARRAAAHSFGGIAPDAAGFERGSRAGDLRRALVGCVQEDAWAEAVACLELASAQRAAAAEHYWRTTAELQPQGAAAAGVVHKSGGNSGNRSIRIINSSISGGAGGLGGLV